MVDMLTPAELVPYFDGKAQQPRFRERGAAFYLLAGTRIARHDDGRIVRSHERFPSGAVRAVELPPRLDGGWLFYQSNGQSTRLWRTARCLRS